MEYQNLQSSELLPHRAGMLLVDKALECNDDSVTAEAIIKDENLFVHEGTIGAWVLLEYMAQTMAMWTSWNARRQGLPPPIGFLLGTRQLKLFVPQVPVGTKLLCKATRIYVSEGDGVAQFQCEVFSETQLLAQAALNAYEPKNPKQFLEQH